MRLLRPAIELPENHRNMSSHKVSVCMITYNHAPFIRQAVESVLMQQTDFDFELVIGEDYSTDGTRDIVLEMAKKYSNIRLILSDANVGMHSNARRTLAACRGEYIAMLEGDDYWTSPAKLQMQVDLMDERQDVHVCIHDAEVIGNNRRGNSGSVEWPQVLQTVGFDYFLCGGVGYTCSAVFRRRAMPQWQDWFETLPGADYTMFILTTLEGFAVILPDKMAAYRQHAGGVCSSRTEQEQLIASHEMLLGFERHLPPAAAAVARASRLQLLHSMMDRSVHERERRLATEAAFLSSRSYRLGNLLLLPLHIVGKRLRG